MVDTSALAHGMTMLSQNVWHLEVSDRCHIPDEWWPLLCQEYTIQTAEELDMMFTKFYTICKKSAIRLAFVVHKKIINWVGDIVKFQKYSPGTKEFKPYPPSIQHKWWECYFNNKLNLPHSTVWSSCPLLSKPVSPQSQVWSEHTSHYHRDQSTDATKYNLLSHPPQLEMLLFATASLMRHYHMSPEGSGISDYCLVLQLQW